MIKVAERAAREAGEILLGYKGSAKIKWKNDSTDMVSIVTDADYASEEKIISILKSEFPEHYIFSEERGEENNSSSEYRWYVDPIDGTANFARDIPLFGISIGLIKSGEPILGVLFFPSLDLMVSAEKGRGAFANGKKIHVSDRDLKHSLYCAHGYYKGKHQALESIVENVGLQKMFDASSYELAKIAMGDAEIYYLESVLHDVVAGICIVSEAGGKITDGDGNPWSVDSKTILVTNGKIHSEVLKLIKESVNKKGKKGFVK